MNIDEVTTGSAAEAATPAAKQQAIQCSPARPAAMFVASKQLVPKRKPLQFTCPSKGPFPPTQPPSTGLVPLQSCTHATMQAKPLQQHRSGEVSAWCPVQLAHHQFHTIAVCRRQHPGSVEGSLQSSNSSTATAAQCKHAHNPCQPLQTKGEACSTAAAPAALSPCRSQADRPQPPTECCSLGSWAQSASQACPGPLATLTTGQASAGTSSTAQGRRPPAHCP